MNLRISKSSRGNEEGRSKSTEREQIADRRRTNTKRKGVYIKG